MNGKRAVAAAVVVVLAAVAWLAYRADGDAADTLLASGTVEATEADLGFQVGGRIEQLLVREGDVVAAGQVLATLDTAELGARRAAAEAQVAAARATLAELRAGARPEEQRVARAAEHAARERLQEAERAHERTRALEAGGAASREALEQARSAYEVARAQHQQAIEQVRLATVGARAERIEAQRAALQHAEAMLAQAAAVLSQAVITAPFGGVVTVRHRQPGEAVGAGAAVLTVMDPSDRWVRIYVREDAIGRVSLGQAAGIRSDSDPSRVFDGRVTFIATQAEFTPRNVQTPGERVRLVYAVKVSIVDDARLMLKPGVPADVRLLGDT